MMTVFSLNSLKKAVKPALGMALLATTSLSALAQVSLNVGDNVVVTAINGQEIKNGLFTEPKRHFTLDAGKHVITAKYTHLFELNGDNHDVLRSSNISLPVELADNQTYELVMAGQPDNYSQAKDYVKHPVLAVTQNGRTLATQQAVDSDGTGIFSGLGNALGGIFGGGNKAVQANQQTIASLDGKSASSNSIPAIAPSTATSMSASADTLDQFMQLWLKATPAERDKMRQWMQK